MTPPPLLPGYPSYRANIGLAQLGAIIKVFRQFPLYHDVIKKRNPLWK